MNHRPHATSTPCCLGGQLRTIAALCVLLLFILPASAEIQNEQIGFSPNHVFDGSLEVENIDIMTGNVNLRIPIGQRFMLNEWFGYQLTLYYNARLWKHRCDYITYPPVGCPGTLLDDQSYGIGFQLHFGRIYSDEDDKPGVYRYQSSSGAEHIFCDDSEGTSECGDYFDYTTDPSHLLFLPNGGDTWAMYPGDGTKVTFAHHLSGGQSGDEWYATRIETTQSYGGQPHAVDITYTPGSTTIDKIEDTAGRLIDFYGIPGVGTGISLPASMERTPSTRWSTIRSTSQILPTSSIRRRVGTRCRCRS